MYVCVNIYICLYICVDIYIYFICMYVCMYVYIYTYVYVCVYVYYIYERLQRLRGFERQVKASGNAYAYMAFICMCV